MVEEVFWNGGGDSCYLQIICRDTHIHLYARHIQLQILKAAHITDETEQILVIDFQLNSSPTVLIGPVSLGAELVITW